MKTARQIVERAYRLARVTSHHRPMTATEAAHGLEAMQALVASWSGHGRRVPSLTKRSEALTSGQATYTWGSGGDIATPIPRVIDVAFVRSSSTDYPVTQMAPEEYARVGNKSTQGRPRRFVYEPAEPLASLTVYPTPGTGYTLHMWVTNPLTSPTLISDSMTAYSDELTAAIEANLAVVLAPEYGLVAAPDVRDAAAEGEALIIKLNSRHRIPASTYTTGITRRDLYGAGTGETFEGG